MPFLFLPPSSSSSIRPLQSISGVKLFFKKRAMFHESWCKLTIQRDHSHCENQKTHTNVVCEHVCMLVGWLKGGVFWSPFSWMRSHPCLRGKRPLLWGLQASGHQWDARAHSHTGRDSPQWSSITPLFWVIPLSLGWLGIISFLHKKLCKSFHPMRWVLGPLTWVDILICCRKTVPPPCQSGELHGKTQAGLMTLMQRRQQNFKN